jgi:DNA polymerase III delta prime subunit
MDRTSRQPRLHIAPRERWLSLWEEAAAATHPADRWQPADPVKPFTVADVRDLHRFAGQTPVGVVKAAYLPAVDTLRNEVANALLKLLEEPPPYLHCLLTAESRRILPTVLSRVVIISHPESGENSEWSAVLTALPRETARERRQASELLYLASLRHAQVRSELVLSAYRHVLPS